MAGYPPKPLEGDGVRGIRFLVPALHALVESNIYICVIYMNVQESTLQSLGVRSGSVLVVKEPLFAPGSGPAKPTSVFLRRVVPADNSCLFNAIGYVLRA